MAEINYPLAVVFVLIAVCLLIWLIRANQKDRNYLRKMFPGHKFHRRHLKKNNLNI